MAIRVAFDAKISALAGGASGTEATAETVREALFQVARAFPALHLFNCEGELRRIIRVRRNGELAALAEAVQDGDTLGLSVE